MGLRQQLHDRLWGAYARWHALRDAGATKFDLKMKGINDAGDPNRYTCNLIFCGETLRTYEKVLGRFVNFAARQFGVARLEEIGKREFREYIDRAIQAGLAAKTLKTIASAIAKAGALIGKSEAFAGLAARYSRKISELAHTGTIAGPARATPGVSFVDRAIEVLRSWDARHFDRTSEPRAYHLAARLQRETGCRRISATERVTVQSLRDCNRITLIGKGGKEMSFILSPHLHRDLKSYLSLYPGPLADAERYRNAYARAMAAAGSHVHGTHGARRAAAKEHYQHEYRAALASGLSPKEAADRAAGNAIERLGHSRNRRDHRRWYLGR